MRKTLPFLMLCLNMMACNLLVFSPQNTFEKLAAAQTAEAEAAAFEQIWNNAEELGFSAYDAAGEPLPVSGPDFPSRLHSIELRVDGQSYHHILVEPENIFILMRE